MTPRRVLVVGLARTGESVARRLAAEGWEVCVGDDADVGSDPEREARRERVVAEGVEVVGGLEPEAWLARAEAADLVVASPGVAPGHPALQAAVRAGVPVRAEIDLAAERLEVPLVAVTGTNGKTTVTELVTAMLVASGVRARSAGNIGEPLLDMVDVDVDVVVAEVSSFQLEHTTVLHPRAAVLLAVTPDHLDWHGSFEAYASAKAKLVARQDDDDLCVYDADDPTATRLAAAARGRRAGFTVAGAPGAAFRRVGERLVGPDGQELATTSDLRRSLPHDVANALAASAAALHVGATAAGVRDALREFEGLPHRVALVGDAGGVHWYDDSKATNPAAARRAVAAFDSVVLLAGGRNKGLDLGVLSDAAPPVRAVVAMGEAAGEVEEAFAGRCPVVRSASMHEAVRAAAGLACPGDVVLLSPGCASFDAYPGYAARGDDFAAEVRRLDAEGGGGGDRR